MLYMTTYERLKVAHYHCSTTTIDYCIQLIFMYVYQIELRETISVSVTHLAPGMAAATARSLTVSVVTPLELVRTIQSGGSTDPGYKIARYVKTATCRLVC
jgi:hypothetical protein